MRKGIILAIGSLALLGCAGLAGCGGMVAKDAGTPVQPKWKGAPYRLAIDTKAAKPNPSGVTIPPVTFTANPEAIETRALLVMRFSAAPAAGKEPVEHRMIGAPVDIKGEEGALPADYLERASKGLAEYLGEYCIQGKVDVSLALARSSLNPQAPDADVDKKRLSDWVPIEVIAKKSHSKC